MGELIKKDELEHYSALAAERDNYPLAATTLGDKKHPAK